MPRDLSGKAIIVTGASSGIGAATAVACAEAGMDVVLSARRAERLADVAREVATAGRRAEIVVGDVAEAETTRKLLAAAQDAFGGFHAVFANAGYGMARTAVEASPTDLRHIFEVNFFAAADLLQAAARRLLDEGRPGHLLMCSSCLAKFTLPRYSAYSATKAAQNHLCRAMNMELRRSGIHVSSVHPITTATEFFQESAARSGSSTLDGPAPGAARGMFVQSPRRVANAVVACLRRPRPEVWTSHTVRSVAAFMTFAPRVADLMLRGGAKERRTAPQAGPQPAVRRT
jgi:short-subunit dehydrogenase